MHRGAQLRTSCVYTIKYITGACAARAETKHGRRRNKTSTSKSARDLDPRHDARASHYTGPIFCIRCLRMCDKNASFAVRFRQYQNFMQCRVIRIDAPWNPSFGAL